jgi:hypothetical protein
MYHSIHHFENTIRFVIHIFRTETLEMSGNKNKREKKNQFKRNFYGMYANGNNQNKH